MIRTCMQLQFDNNNNQNIVVDVFGHAVDMWTNVSSNDTQNSCGNSVNDLRMKNVFRIYVCIVHTPLNFDMDFVYENDCIYEFFRCGIK